MFLTCFRVSFFPFWPLCWPPLFIPFSRRLFALLSPSNSPLFCRAGGTAQRLERGDFSMDLSKKFGKVRECMSWELWWERLDQVLRSKSIHSRPGSRQKSLLRQSGVGGGSQILILMLDMSLSVLCEHALSKLVQAPFVCEAAGSHHCTLLGVQAAKRQLSNRTIEPTTVNFDLLLLL